ncbi:HD domain-containing protein [Fulvivirga sp. RKSG066]|uniref:HD domain-containing protein n=1 Tax=Fulvivirga aurantia TaxID=2529383 RepID=UPI0012BCDE9B|nr:HD domain-containing protein [Fulvivirga aurantia]MTI19541.1 HD domain-containing protein [Fulvivirga aurantia]
MKKCANIIKASKMYVSDIVSSLPPEFYYHNLQHTQYVVEGVKIMSDYHVVSPEKREKLILAAWFHDTGFIESYKNHESHSQHIATQFLHNLNCSESDILQVCHLIEATRLPTNPKSLSEKIICDADMRHLAANNYMEINNKLRQEVMSCCHEKFDDETWAFLNLRFLEIHRYYTSYAKEILRPKKEVNIAQIEYTYS